MIARTRAMIIIVEASIRMAAVGMAFDLAAISGCDNPGKFAALAEESGPTPVGKRRPQGKQEAGNYPTLDGRTHG